MSVFGRGFIQVGGGGCFGGVVVLGVSDHL